MHSRYAGDLGRLKTHVGSLHNTITIPFANIITYKYQQTVSLVTS